MLKGGPGSGRRKGGGQYKPSTWEPHYSDSLNLKRYKEIYRTANTLDLPFDFNYDPKSDTLFALNKEAKENFKTIVQYWKNKGKNHLLKEKEMKKSVSPFELDKEVEALIKASDAWTAWDGYTRKQRQNVIDIATNIVKSRIDIEVEEAPLEKGLKGGKYLNKKKVNGKWVYTYKTNVRKKGGKVEEATHEASHEGVIGGLKSGHRIDEATHHALTHLKEQSEDKVKELDSKIKKLGSVDSEASYQERRSLANERNKYAKRSTFLGMAAAGAEMLLSHKDKIFEGNPVAYQVKMMLQEADKAIAGE